MRFVHVVSCSTGKDSQATLLLAIERCGIENVVEWAKTTRCGKQFDLLQETESPACSSSYGLCDQPSKE